MDCYKIAFKMGTGYLAKLDRLAWNLRDDVIGKAVYDGASVVADAVAEELSKVPTDEGVGTPDTPTIGPKEKTLREIYNGFGISPARDDRGFLNVKLGFDGYSSVKTKRWPNGQPIQMLARAVESGASWMRKNPFVEPAVRRTRAAAKTEMNRRVNEEIEKIMRRE